MAVGTGVQRWATAISSNAHTGRKIIFRYAEAFSPDFNRTFQSVRIIIVWKYQSEKGQPTPEELEQMYLLEDTLEAVLNEHSFVTLALVSTGEDLREWTYYAKSEDEFMARLNYAFMEMPRFPIEIHIAHDPDWTTYTQFRSGVQETVN
jgi:hypothetical protein